MQCRQWKSLHKLRLYYFGLGGMANTAVVNGCELAHKKATARVAFYNIRQKSLTLDGFAAWVGCLAAEDFFDHQQAVVLGDTIRAAQ